MGYTTNRSILEKADLALADLTTGGGVLAPAQSQKFMRLLIKQSVLMGMATVVPMAAPKQEISKIKFGSRILRPGQEGVALVSADRSKPDMTSVELDAKLYKNRSQNRSERLICKARGDPRTAAYWSYVRIRGGTRNAADEPRSRFGDRF